MIKTKFFPNTNLQILCERDLEGELENLRRVMKDVKEECDFQDVLGDMKCSGCIYNDPYYGCFRSILSTLIFRYIDLIERKKKEEEEDEE